MTSKLLGLTLGVNTSNLSGSFICITHTGFVAAADGVVTEIVVQIAGGATGSVTAAIYGDTGSNAPGPLLGVSASTAVVAGTAMRVPLPQPVGVRKNYLYWLAMNSSVTFAVSDGTAGSLDYKALTYGNAFPDPFGAGTSNLGQQLDLQAWGWPYGSPGFEMLLIAPPLATSPPALPWAL